mmetsp:Transcript_565/g.1333  ORF Transcript_565/g.1333 Transcript_565/m.1333 type:complete len:285 (-) Transcript_565:621-1475(-)
MDSSNCPGGNVGANVVGAAVGKSSIVCCVGCVSATMIFFVLPLSPFFPSVPPRIATRIISTIAPSMYHLKFPSRTSETSNHDLNLLGAPDLVLLLLLLLLLLLSDLEGSMDWNQSFAFPRILPSFLKDFSGSSISSRLSSVRIRAIEGKACEYNSSLKVSPSSNSLPLLVRELERPFELSPSSSSRSCWPKGLVCSSLDSLSPNFPTCWLYPYRFQNKSSSCSPSLTRSSSSSLSDSLRSLSLSLKSLWLLSSSNTPLFLPKRLSSALNSPKLSSSFSLSSSSS